jgi:hypothetical protein
MKSILRIRHEIFFKENVIVLRDSTKESNEYKSLKAKNNINKYY